MIHPSVRDHLVSRLLDWQRDHGRQDLPWQSTRDPYRIWLAEMMLQQTQVATVLPYYHRFLQSFPSLESLAHAPLDAVLAHWAGLGYYRRAHHLHHAALSLVELISKEKSTATYPSDLASWQSLAGVGRSTAASIVSSAFGAAQPILDGNVKRIYARFFWGRERSASADLSSEDTKNLWVIAETMMQSPLATRHARQWNQALMDLGAMVCTRNALCTLCPWNDSAADLTKIHACQYQEARGQEKSPLSAQKITKQVETSEDERILTMVILYLQGKVWLEKRPPKGLWSGLWCPPLIEGKSITQWQVLSHEPSLAALQGAADLLPRHKRAEKVDEYTHQLTHRRFAVRVMAWEIAPDSARTIVNGEGGQWVPLSVHRMALESEPLLAAKMPTYGIPTIFRKALPSLKARFGGDD
jgi:A/G-specific adenine glycosylase